MATSPQHMRTEIERRRTFAIISHPDAGKTTLTEKLLLYGGAIHLAGTVKERRAGRRTSSDWMEMERQRGISITTSVLQFDYHGKRMNLLDTPGHDDFSEDTYRTLAAADSVVMLIDSVKGVEPQTIKLFKVCRMRGIPIVTFINKLDRPGQDPFDLLSEIERILGIPCSPANWPVGSGSGFKGVYDRWGGRMLQYERLERGARQAPVTVRSLDDPAFKQMLGPTDHGQLVEDLELLEAGDAFDRAAYLAGELTPVFFGSAITNFGVEPFLEHFCDLAPLPQGRPVEGASPVDPFDPAFSAFVFKIQANMDPAHRDRVAFARVCSGRFERGMTAKLSRTGKHLTLAKPLQFFGQERSNIDEAFAGDIIGLWDQGNLHIGDSLCAGPVVEFEGIPRFSPEHFVRVSIDNPMRRKQLKKGLEQLSEEGAVQLFFDRRRLERDPVLGAVGVLQFEVTQYRLDHEYGVQARYERLPFVLARWIEGDVDLDRFEEPGRMTCLLDVEGRPLVLFETEWALRTAERNHPKLRFIAATQPGRVKR